MSRVAYQIRVTGDLPERFFEDFSRVTIAVDPVGTTLRADLTDQAELNGLLDALRRDGLVLVEVRREQVFGSDEQEETDDGGPEDAPPTTW
jgi:hypothetical protein